MQIRNTVTTILALSSLSVGPAVAPGHAASRPSPRPEFAAQDIDYTPVGSAHAVEMFRDHGRTKLVPRPGTRNRAADHDGS